MTDVRRPRLGATVRIVSRGRPVQGVLVRRDARRTDLPAQITVLTSDVNDHASRRSHILSEDGRIPVKTVSEPSPDGWLVLTSLGGAPYVYAMADDEAGIRAWIAANPTATIQGGDFRVLRHADVDG